MAAMLMYGESLREKMLKGVNDYLKLAASSYGVMSFNRIIDEMVILKLQMILIFKVLM